MLRHLLARYDVPTWFDAVFLTGDGAAQRWFVHVAQGGNLRAAPGLPVTLTKKRVPRRPSPEVSWRPCGVRGFDRIEGDGANRRRVLVVELLNGADLVDEGRRMHHCVAGYARQCLTGGTAILSLRVGSAGDFKSRVTLELSVAARQVVQARGPCNAMPLPQEARWLRAWATAAGVTFSPYVLRTLHG